MRLYHSQLFGFISTRSSVLAVVLLAAALFLLGCAAQPAQMPDVRVTVQADGETFTVDVPAGSTVQDVLTAAGIRLNDTDRTEPAANSPAEPGSSVRVVRVEETYEVVHVVIPFERQTLRNESLPAGSENEVYLQRGKNGVQEVTYRRVLEDGIEVANSPVKSSILEEPIPEIVMVGIQSPFYPVALPGRLVYLRDGNAWMMEGSTGNRRAVITTGDLDGRVFSLSDDGNWLLFTRSAHDLGQINSLWAMNVVSETAKIIDLNVSNVIHFADWVPGTTTKVIFSTVEPRASAPGWQANNDLNVLRFSSNGWIKPGWDVVMEPNSGGIYGWWGMDFAWQPGGDLLAFARPDGIGLVNFADGQQEILAELVPYQTGGDWAWVPGLTWGPDGQVLYGLDHIPSSGSLDPEKSPQFDLTALSLSGGPLLRVVDQVGMFAYPLTSPVQSSSSENLAYQVAYLQAASPQQSDSSRYHVMIMDRDGSNRRKLFPEEGLPGLTPEAGWGAWSPVSMPESGHYALGLVYGGNLWLVDAETGEAMQVTGDGLTTRIDWK